LKIKRILKSLELINSNAEKKIPFFNFIKLALIHLYVSHYCACLMYSIAYYELDNNPGQNMVDLNNYF